MKSKFQIYRNVIIINLLHFFFYFHTAIYVEHDFDWESLISPSKPNFDDLNRNIVDRTFRQGVRLADVDIYHFKKYEDDLDLSANFSGQYQCVEGCREEGYEFALLNKEICYCNYFLADINDQSYRVFEVSSLFEPCPDDENMDCGHEGIDEIVIYPLAPEFGSNFGYKYWQTIQKPAFGHYKELLEENDIPHEDKKVAAPSECFSFCKQQNEYDLAILDYNPGSLDGSNQFNCFCMFTKLYKFVWQDIVTLTDSELAWCPDVHGPCVKDVENDEHEYSVVYCLDNCNMNLLLEPTNYDMCKLGQHETHPNDGISEVFYNCTKSSKNSPFPKIHASFEKQTCPEGEFFYPNITSCKTKCTAGDVDANCQNEYFECETNDQGEDVWIGKNCPGRQVYSPIKGCVDSCDEDDHQCESTETHCICLDDDQLIWNVSINTNGSKPCSEHDASLIGKIAIAYFDGKT